MQRFWLIIILFGIIFAEPYVSEIITNAIEKKYGLQAKERFLSQHKILESLKDKSDDEKLEAVNNFYNNTPYLSDLKNWKKKDYWATPLEFLGKDRADCEDYVISKYFALKYLGVDIQKLYFSYVKSLKYRQAHMVLTYFKTPKSIPLVLDNYNHKILPANKRRDLIPVYNFNGDSLFIANKKGENSKKMKKSKKTHKKWDILIENIQRNKL